MMPAAAREERMHRRHLLAGLAGMLAAPAGRPALRSPSSRSGSFFRSRPAASAMCSAASMAEHLRAAVDRPAIVENRTGAAGRLGVQAVKAAPPNGSVLLLTPIAPISIYPHFYPQLEYDPFTDLEPLSQLVTFEFALAVSKRVPATSLRSW